MRCITIGFFRPQHPCNFCKARRTCKSMQLALNGVESVATRHLRIKLNGSTTFAVTYMGLPHCLLVQYCDTNTHKNQSETRNGQRWIPSRPSDRYTTFSSLRSVAPTTRLQPMSTISLWRHGPKHLADGDYEDRYCTGGPMQPRLKRSVPAWSLHSVCHLSTSEMTIHYSSFCLISHR